jgi:hypothetical protein
MHECAARDADRAAIGRYITSHAEQAPLEKAA